MLVCSPWLMLKSVMFIILAGDCLLSSGDDGTVRFWKKSLSGEWLEFAETNMTDEYASSLYAELCYL